MKIGMMSAWNEDSGASIHAELIGREWVKSGHNLSVFSFLKTDFHGTAILDNDEAYVYRCFTTSNAKPLFMDKESILKMDYDIFVVQDLGMIPQNELATIFPIIKKKAKTVTVIHHNKLPEEPSFYKFDWDKIIYFDDRYYNFLKEGFPIEKLYQIPYPCFPKNFGDKFRAREELNLAQNKNILLVFGPKAVRTYQDLLPFLEEINHPILFILVTTKDLEKVKNSKNNNIEILIRPEIPNLKKLYTYLHASDILLYHRPAPFGVLVSSTAFQCLGSGCPMLCLKSNYFYNMENEVFLYGNFDEFKSNFMEILNKSQKFHNWEKRLNEFLNKNSSNVIANRYIELFNNLLEK